MINQAIDVKYRMHLYVGSTHSPKSTPPIIRFIGHRLQKRGNTSLNKTLRFFV
jgi:hypothetical protein